MCDCSLEFDLIEEIYKQGIDHLADEEYVYDYIKNSYCTRKALSTEDSSPEKIFAKLIIEANDRAKITEEKGEMVVEFPIRYVRDVILFFIYLRYNNVPYKGLDYIYCIYYKGVKRFIMYKSSSPYGKVFKPSSIRLANQYNEFDIVSDNNKLFATFKFADDNDVSEDSYVTFGAGCKVFIKARKKYHKSKPPTFVLDNILISAGYDNGLADFN